MRTLTRYVKSRHRSVAGDATLAAWIAVLAPELAVADATAPELSIVEAPPACCAGAWAGEFRGSVAGADPATTAVVLYARTDLYYIQPYTEATLDIDALGRWGSEVRGGTSYAALLVRQGYRPPATLVTLPQAGGDVLAVRRAPEDQRRIEFAGRPWIVKSGGASVFGPGANLWSDDARSAWTDAAGELHLRLEPRQGSWYAAEVYCELPLGFGRYRFEVAGPVDRLDPNVVFAGFLYADSGAELDVEWTRWGDASSTDNAQFSAPPDRRARFAHAGGAGPTTGEILWLEDRAAFSLRAGALHQPGQPIAAWSLQDSIPDPAGARMRFNLWLVGGQPPTDGQPVEVVISGFEFERPTDVASTSGAPRWRLEAPAVATGGRLDYQVELERPGSLVIQLLDVRGRRIATLFDGRLGSGTHPLAWQPGPAVPLARGVYFLAARSGSETVASKLVWPR